jgi:hypothetical protein
MTRGSKGTGQCLRGVSGKAPKGQRLFGGYPLPSGDQWPVEHSPAGATPRPGVGQLGARLAEHQTAAAAERGRGDRHAPRRWGLWAAAPCTGGERRSAVWRRWRDAGTPRTRATRANASTARRGPWTMAQARHVATRARHLPGDAGPARQPCLATAPGAGHAVCAPLHAARKAPAALAQGRTRLLAERADAQAGPPHAGAARPAPGRRGQGALCRGAPCLPAANGGRWARGAGARLVPAAGVGAAGAPPRHARGHPPERPCAPPSAVGGQRGQRVQAPGGPGALLAWAALDGRESPWRAAVAPAGVRAAAQGLADPNGEGRAPPVGVPEQRGQRGRPLGSAHV